MKSVGRCFSGSYTMCMSAPDIPPSVVVLVGRLAHTKNICSALRLLALVFFFPSVISFSASRWASLALGQVVLMDSWVMREVTRLRRRACRCEDLRFRWRYFMAPPAIMVDLRAERIGKVACLE